MQWLNYKIHDMFSSGINWMKTRKCIFALSINIDVTKLIWDAMELYNMIYRNEPSIFNSWKCNFMKNHCSGIILSLPWRSRRPREIPLCQKYFWKQLLNVILQMNIEEKKQLNVFSMYNEVQLLAVKSHKIKWNLKASLHEKIPSHYLMT